MPVLQAAMYMRAQQTHSRHLCLCTCNVVVCMQVLEGWRHGGAHALMLHQVHGRGCTKLKPEYIACASNYIACACMQVLEGGGMEEADAWLVLRGILAGLAHIHSQVRGQGGG